MSDTVSLLIGGQPVQGFSDDGRGVEVYGRLADPATFNAYGEALTGTVDVTEYYEGEFFGTVVYTDNPETAFIENNRTGNISEASFQYSSVTFEAPCFATGTLIATVDGDCPVERLAVGRTVRLYDGDSTPVAWIGNRRHRGGQIVRIRAGALGQGTPRHDLIVSTDHGLFLDGVLVQAGLLVNGDTVRLERRDEVTFWHVELDRHAILIAEGAPAESYLDTGNRRQFANCALAACRIWPSSATIRHGEFCSV